MKTALLRLAVGLLGLAGWPALGQTPAPAASVPMPAALRARLRAARTDSVRYRVHFEAMGAYAGTLDSAGVVGNLHACLRLARRLGDSLRVGSALAEEGMYNLQVDNLARAYGLLRQAEARLRQAPDTTRTMVAYYMSMLYNDLNRPAEAMRYARTAVALLRGQHSGQGADQLAEIYTSMGGSYLRQGQPDSAVAVYLQSLRLFRQLQDRREEASTLGSLAVALLRQQQPDQALRYATQAYALVRADGDSTGMMAQVERLGAIALASGRPALARGYLRQMARLARSLGRRDQLPTAYGRLAQAHEQLHRPDSARHYHARALAVARPLRLPTLGLRLVEAAELEQHQRRYPAAEALAREALALDGGRPSTLYTVNAWRVLRAVAEARGDYAEAYRLLRQEQAFVTQQQQADNRRLSETLRLSYETEQTQQRVALLEKEQELTRLRTRQQLAGVAGAAGLLLLGAGLLFVRYRRRQAAARAAAAAALRERLAADLHDDLGPLLTQLAVESSLLRENVYAPDQLLARLRHLGETSQQAAQHLGAVLRELDAGPAAAAAAPLAELVNELREHAHEALSPHEMGLTLTLADLALAGRLLPAATRHALALIFREALHNVVKHAAGATLVRATIGQESDGLLLTLQDDGRLGPAAATARPGGRGLRSMHTRAEALGGWLTAAPGPGGFAVRAWLPG